MSSSFGIENAVLSSLVSHVVVPIVYHLLPPICMYVLGVSMVGPNAKLLSVNEIYFWQERGLDVYTWTVNAKERLPFYLSQNVSVGTDDCRDIQK
jgi:hypothetical protein